MFGGEERRYGVALNCGDKKSDVCLVANTSCEQGRRCVMWLITHMARNKSVSVSRLV